MKSILIMGANPETASLVQKARQMGLITYVTDYNPDAFAKKYADRPLNIDASDVDSLVGVVEREQIDAVLVGVAEALMPSYYEVCRRTGKPCFVAPEYLETMMNKARFKEACRRYGVPVVEEYSADRLDEVRFPAVVKPVDSCSSKGISVCRTKRELMDAVDKALGFSRSGKFIVERYMTGEEVVIYYAIQDGEPTLVGMCDRYTNREQKGLAPLPTAYVFPSRLLGSYIERTDASVCNMLKELGIRNGVLFLQAFVEDGEVRIYEPGFRLNGAQEHILVSAATGIDAKELMINFALTGSMQMSDLREKAAPDFHGLWGCKLSPLIRTGRIAKISGLEEIAKMDGVLSVNPSYAEGDTVSGQGTLRQIVSRFFIMADTPEMLEKRIGAIMQKLVVEDEHGESMLLTPFTADLITKLYAN